MLSQKSLKSLNQVQKRILERAGIRPEEKDMRLRLVQHVVNPTVHDICIIYRHSLIIVPSYYVCIVKPHTLVRARTSQ